MSETRKQFRERIGRIACDRDGGIWDEETPYYHDMYTYMAEAVYAEALRDVLRLMQEREIVLGDFVATINTLTDDDLATFAFERGINLHGEEAQR